ncbi:MAG: transcription-repair coupling factor, partial [Bacteroidetes bacterium HGW-Bacteroidetes-22]
MNSKELIDIYRNNSRVKDIVAGLQAGTASRLHVTGLKGSALPMVAAAIHSITQGIHVLIIDDKEKAAYTFNDMEQLFDERELPFDKRRILFFPTAYRRPYEIEHTDNANVLSRTEVLNKVNNVGRNLVIVTYPEALSEKVVTKKVLKKNTFQLREGEEVSLDFLTDVLIEYGFDRVDFVVEPGQFAIRGGIVDLFSFSDEYPYRIEFSGDEAESIRTFNPVTQLSLQRLTRIAIMPDIQDRFSQEARETLIEYLPETSVFWLDDITYISERLDLEMDKARKVYEDLNRDIKHLAPGELLTSGKLLLRQLTERKLIQYGTKPAFESEVIGFNIKIQPTFNRNFDLLLTDLRHHTEKSYINILCAENQRQLTRLETIFKDLERDTPALQRIAYKSLNIGLHEGFVDEDIQLACYTDHQIFERYHRYRIREGFAGREAITLKELYNLKPGDYVTHIDHGIGRFDGMEIIENNGRQQEVI